MLNQFEVEENVYNVVAALQDAGYETYIVGGAIRDHLMERAPKDYDISTAATPEQVREVFGRRRARIIGRRFQLVHVRAGRELFEVSTFRSAPSTNKHEPQTPGARKIAEMEEAENMIFNDNDFGTSEEDAWRRDFTVNALFYDPVADELIDYTGSGISDIKNGLVRAIGDPVLRFEEDPVRMLRALKLVGQYGFKLERKTENALLEKMHLLELASVSRLSLELEKVLNSSYAGSIMQAFADYGLIRHFLPYMAKSSEKNHLQEAVNLLKIRDKRIAAGYYRNSASLAMAALALPFIDALIDGEYRKKSINSSNDEQSFMREWHEELLRQALLTVYAPLTIIKRLNISACRMLAIQPMLFNFTNYRKLVKLRGFAHAMELLKVQCDADYIKCAPEFITQWRNAIASIGGVNRMEEHCNTEDSIEAATKHRRRRRRGRKGGARRNADEANRKEIAAAAQYPA